MLNIFASLICITTCIFGEKDAWIGPCRYCAAMQFELFNIYVECQISIVNLSFAGCSVYCLNKVGLHGPWYLSFLLYYGKVTRLADDKLCCAFGGISCSFKCILCSFSVLSWIILS